MLNCNSSTQDALAGLTGMAWTLLSNKLTVRTPEVLQPSFTLVRLNYARIIVNDDLWKI
jgi:hypothetical protein